MQLHYLVFDVTDEDSGRGSFDAMASVEPGRLPALLAEIGRVLAWAHRAFGPAGALDDGGEWDYALQALAEPDSPLDAVYEGDGRVVLASAGGGATLTTLALTLTGSPGFCQAMRDAFVGLE
jgi:hypothetical protein